MKHSFPTRQRGVSLMMVTAFIGVASIMGMAVLSSQTLQTTACASADQAAQADALAESGLNVGLYYLQNLNDSSKCPSTVGSASYKETGGRLGSTVNGTYDLTIAYNSRANPTRYTLTSVGTAGAKVSRTLTATVDVNYFGYGLFLWNSSSTTTLPVNVNVTGDVFARAGVQNNGTVSGTLYSDTVSGSGTAGSTRSISGVNYTPVPSTVAHYYPLYTYYKDGRSYSPANILLGSLTGATLSVNLISNPAGVHYHSGDLTLAGNTKITGTLVVTGKLYVSGTGNSITSTSHYPALVVDSDINFMANGAQLDVIGLVYAGAKVAKASGVSSGKLNITGALLTAGGSSAFDPLVQVNIKYDRARASVPSLTNLARPAPTSVSINNWKN